MFLTQWNNVGLSSLAWQKLHEVKVRLANTMPFHLLLYEMPIVHTYLLLSISEQDIGKQTIKETERGIICCSSHVSKNKNMFYVLQTKTILRIETYYLNSYNDMCV